MAQIKLMLHQLKGKKYLRYYNGKGALFMEMRLGKTLTAINFLLQEGAKKILVVSPYSVINSWAEDLEKMEIGEDQYSALKGTREERLKELKKNKKWILSNYESAEKLELHKINFDAIILDESIRIANPKSKVAKYFLKNFSNVKIRIILCGNPAPENMLQYVTQYIFFNGNFMGFKNYWSFRNNKYMQVGFDWLPLPDVDIQASRYVHTTAFVLSRKDAGIGSIKLYQTRQIKMNAEQKKQYKSMKKNFEYGSREEKNSLGQITSLARIAGGCSCEGEHYIISDNKIKQILYLLKSELKNQKILVWCRFKAEAEQVSNYLRNCEYKNILITGDVDVEERKELKARFAESSLVNIAVLTIASCAKGQDWSAADTAIYYSNEYSNDLRSQSEDRICHPKKKTPLLIVDLITEDSIDERVLKILKDKKFQSRFFMSRLIKELKPI